MREVCSMLTIETLRRSGIFIINLKQISRIILVFLMSFLNK